MASAVQPTFYAAQPICRWPERQKLIIGGWRTVISGEAGSLSSVVLLSGRTMGAFTSLQSPWPPPITVRLQRDSLVRNTGVPHGHPFDLYMWKYTHVQMVKVGGGPTWTCIHFTRDFRCYPVRLPGPSSPKSPNSWRAVSTLDRSIDTSSTRSSNSSCFCSSSRSMRSSMVSMQAYLNT